MALTDTAIRKIKPGTVCVVGKMRDLILQLSKSSIYSTKPESVFEAFCPCFCTLIYFF